MNGTILYIHGLGGGGDSRIPSLLSAKLTARVVIRTYDFDPRIAEAQIAAWAEEVQPDIIIGESMGACHALVTAGRLGKPCVLVSPALNAPLLLSTISWAALIPGVRQFFNRKYKPREGDRQKIDFRREVIRSYGPLRKEALQFRGEAYAFFGRRDSFRRSGVVSLSTWRRRFPQGKYDIYDGSHYMEEEYIDNLLVPLLQKLGA